MLPKTVLEMLDKAATHNAETAARKALTAAAWAKEMGLDDGQMATGIKLAYADAMLAGGLTEDERSERVSTHIRRLALTLRVQLEPTADGQ